MTKVNFYSTSPEFEAYYNSLPEEKQKEINEAFDAALTGGEVFQRYLEKITKKSEPSETTQAVLDDKSTHEMEQSVEENKSIPVEIDKPNESKRRSLTFGELICPTPEMIMEIYNEDPEFFRRYFDIIDERKSNGKSISRVEALKASNATEYQEMLLHELSDLMDNYMEYENYKARKAEEKKK